MLSSTDRSFGDVLADGGTVRLDSENNAGSPWPEGFGSLVSSGSTVNKPTFNIVRIFSMPIVIYRFQ